MRSSFSLSLAFHALLFLLCLLLLRDQGRRVSARPEDFIQIETPPLTQDEIARLKKENDFRHQIVQTDKGQLTKEAPKDAFLGEHNQVVDRETVSREHRIAMGSQSQKSSPSPARNETANEEKQRSKNHETGTKGEPGKNVEVKPADVALDKLGAPILPSARFGSNGAPPEWSDPHNWADFGSIPQDYVKGLKEGERTALNTKEYVFYGYFQRIRERLDRAWVPILRDRLTKMYRMGRQLASDMDHTTQVLVILNPQGEIVRVQVVEESGTKDLDDAAVRAFNLAGPFPNPPKGIVDAKGEIEIPWQFILKT